MERDGERREGQKEGHISGERYRRKGGTERDRGKDRYEGGERERERWGR